MTDADLAVAWLERDYDQPDAFRGGPTNNPTRFFDVIDDHPAVCLWCADLLYRERSGA